MSKSKKRIEQDLARNAIADGNTSAGRYEANQLSKVASGQATYMKGLPHMYGAPKMQGQPHMESNKQERSNLINNNPVAKHASNSWVSKHMK